MDLEVFNTSVDGDAHGKGKKKTGETGSPAFEELVEESARRSWHRRKVRGEERLRHQRRKVNEQDYQSVCSYYELMY